MHASVGRTVPSSATIRAPQSPRRLLCKFLDCVVHRKSWHWTRRQRTKSPAVTADVPSATDAATALLPMRTRTPKTKAYTTETCTTAVQAHGKTPCSSRYHVHDPSPWYSLGCTFTFGEDGKSISCGGTARTVLVNVNPHRRSARQEAGEARTPRAVNAHVKVVQPKARPVVVYPR